jgi:hypothetical protein
MGPLGISAKQHREYLKLQSQNEREVAKMQAEEKRKQQLHDIKLKEAAAKANQGIGHKEDIHAVKLKELGSPLGKSPRMNKQRLGIPTQNPLANTGMLGQGQRKLKYEEGTDTVPAMLTPGEAVIPEPAAQDPKNKEAIKRMVEEGREANRLRDGAVQVVNSDVPNFSRGSSDQANYNDGTTDVNFMDTIMQGLRKVAPGVGMMIDKTSGVMAGEPGSVPEITMPQVSVETPVQPVITPIPVKNYIANITNPNAVANAGAALADNSALISPNEMANENARLANRVITANAPLQVPKQTTDTSALADDFFRRASWAEAGNNPNARQKQLGQTASGLTGTTADTFRLLQAKYPELQGVVFNSPEYVDPKFQKVLSDIHVKDRIPQITSKGLPVDNYSLYAAGFGPRGVSAFAAKADEPLNKHFNANELKQNPYFGKTAGDFQNFIKKKMDTAGERLGKYETNAETTKLNNLSVSPPNNVPNLQDKEIPKDTKALDALMSELSLSESNPQEAQTAIANVAKQEHSNLDRLIAAIKASDKSPEVKQQEAASLVEQIYGDKGIFNQGDLIRFAITAAGGMLTGGSAAGSLRFASRDALMQSDARNRERTAAERQQRTIDAQNQRQDKSLLTQAAMQEARTLDAEGRADVKAKARDTETYSRELIKEGRDVTAVRQWIAGGQKGSLPPIKQSFIRSGQNELVTVTQPFMFEGKRIEPGTPMYQYNLKDPRTGDIQTMVRIGTKDVPLESAVASNIMLNKWDEGKHGPKAQVEDLMKWSDNSSKRFGEMMKSELGSDDLKGKPNPARQGQVVPMDIQTQAASWALSKGYKINDPASKLELEKINSIATSQAIRDMQSGTKVKDITPYLNASYIKQRSGLSDKLFELDPKKGTQMAPEKIVELRAKGTNAGFKDDATMSAEMKRLSAVWNNNDNNIQRRYKDSANETGFYMFAADALGRMSKNK